MEEGADFCFLENIRFFMLQQVNAIEDILPLAGKLFTKEKEIADHTASRWSGGPAVFAFIIEQ